MKKLLAGLAAVPFLAGVAMAGNPVPLSDAQMDKVTAGFNAAYILDGVIVIWIPLPNPDDICPVCVTLPVLSATIPSVVQRVAAVGG